MRRFRKFFHIFLSLISCFFFIFLHPLKAQVCSPSDSAIAYFYSGSHTEYYEYLCTIDENCIDGTGETATEIVHHYDRFGKAAYTDFPGNKTDSRCPPWFTFNGQYNRNSRLHSIQLKSQVCLDASSFSLPPSDNYPNGFICGLKAGVLRNEYISDRVSKWLEGGNYSDLISQFSSDPYFAGICGGDDGSVDCPLDEDDDECPYIRITGQILPGRRVRIRYDC